MKYLGIIEGERPLFKSLPLIEAIHRNEDPYDVVSAQDILKYVSQLYVLAEILISREQKGLRHNVSDLYPIIKELPLFFNGAQVHQWESDKIWSNPEFISYKPYAMEYEDALESFSPSLAYQPNTDCKNYIWLEWLKKTPLQEIISTLYYSAQKLILWNSQRIKEDTLFLNLQEMGKHLNFTDKQSHCWWVLYTLGHSSSSLWNIYLTEFANDIYSLINIWEKSLQIPNQLLNKIFYQDSQFVENGIFNSLNNLEDFSSWQKIWSEIEIFYNPLIESRLLNNENILQLFLNATPKPFVPMDFWNYIPNIDNIKISLAKKIPLKILVYGNKGIGKSSFISSLLNSIGVKGFEPIYNKFSYYDESEQNKIIKQIHLANNLIYSINGTALIIDNMENKINFTTDVNFIDKIKNTIQFWVFSDLKKLNSVLFKKFDLVIELDEPPLKFRSILTENLFKDKNIALRIAQTIKTPLEILQIYNWCQLSDDYSWKNISTLLASISKANYINKEDPIVLNKVECNDDIVPLTGNKILEDLLVKLTYFFKNPNEYKELGAKAHKGILLVGPPGIGKTHFARNLGKTVDIPVFAPDTSVLANNLASINLIFTEIKRHAPCILFLDEIDTLITSPKSVLGIDLEKQKIVNTFLANIDGIEINEGILIIGATHRFKDFDPAATRSGRLSEVIHVGLPSLLSREKIWEAHLMGKKVNDLNIHLLSNTSAGFSGADIAQAVNKAAILAVENKQSFITMHNLNLACDDVFWGHVDGSKIINPHQRELIAYHEAGHALIAWKNNLIVQRITIRPREHMLGAVHYINEEGIFNMSLDIIKERLQLMLAGICAEKVIFGYYENGGTSDLEKANQLVHHAICEAGLGINGPIFLGDPKYWSNEKKYMLEEEERAIMSEEFEHTEKWLNNNQGILEELANLLLDKKEISGESLIYFKNKVDNLTENLIPIKKNSENITLHSEQFKSD